jgi:hypothetical protein
MPTPQATLQYNGIHAEGGFTVLRTNSSVPDPITAKFLPSAYLPPYGDIALAYGSRFIVLRNCRLLRSELPQGGDGGRFHDVSFEDRRWAWQIPRLFAHWNNPTVYLAGSSSYQKNYKQMIEYICRVVLGEVNADLSAVTEEDFFELSSDGDQAISVLETLLERRGYVVTLDLNDRMAIRRLGVGLFPPNDELVMDRAVAAELPAVPEIVYCLSSHVEFTKDMLLVPVVSYLGGYIPIDSASWRPAGGWGNEDPTTFPNVDVAYRKQALEEVWKLYRIVSPSAVPAPRRYPFDQSIFRTNDYTRLLPLQARQYANSGFDSAKVFGFFAGLQTTHLNNVNFPGGNWTDNWFEQLETSQIDPLVTYSGEFSLDEERGIVAFKDQVFYQNRVGNQLVAPNYLHPYLILRTSFKHRQENGQFIRQIYTYRTGFANARPGLSKTITAEEIQYKVSPRQQTSQGEFELQSEYFVQQELAKLSIDQSASVPCKGFRFDYGTDGRIFAIRWDRSDAGSATTTIDWQTERQADRLTYEEKLRILRDRVMQRRFQELELEKKKRDRQKGRAKVQ